MPPSLVTGARTLFKLAPSPFATPSRSLGYSEQSGLLAIADETKLSIWSGKKHRLCVGNIDLPSGCGQPSHVVWQSKPVGDCWRVVVSCSGIGGHMLFYDVVKLDTRITAHRKGFIPLPSTLSEVEESNIVQAGVYSPKMVRISFAGSVLCSDMISAKVSDGPVSGLRITTPIACSLTSIIVGTNSNYVLNIGWSGLLVSCMQLEDKHGGRYSVMDLCYAPLPKVMALVTCPLGGAEAGGRGTVYIVPKCCISAKKMGLMSPSVPLCAGEASLVDVCSGSQIIAVGLHGGNVSLFSFKVNPTDHIISTEFIRTLSLMKIQRGVEDTIVSMCWSPTGDAIAVGYAQQHLVVWSIFGSLQMCKGGAENSPIKREEGRSGALQATGCLLPRCIHWDQHMNRLLTIESDGKGSCVLSELPLMKPLSNAANYSTPGACRWLYDCDKLTKISTAETSNHDLMLTTIPVYPNYLSREWPIRIAASSKSGNNVAVAGTRGFAVYNAVHNVWKILSDTSYEKAECISIRWLNEEAVMVMYKSGGDEKGRYRGEIRVYSTSAHDRGPQIGHFEFGVDFVPLHMDCDEGVQRMAVVAVNSRVLLLNLSIAYMSERPQEVTADINAVPPSIHAIDTITFSYIGLFDIPQYPSQVSSISLLPAIKAPTGVRGSSSSYLLIHCIDGTLDIFDFVSKPSNLATNIQSLFCVASPPLWPHSLPFSVWAYGSKGLHMWRYYDINRPPSIHNVSVDPLAQFDVEVTPVAIFPMLGIMLGLSLSTYNSNEVDLSQDLALDHLPHFSELCFEVQTSIQPIFQSLLWSLLKENNTTLAATLLTVAMRAKQPFLYQGIELVIHAAVELEYKKWSKSGKPKLVTGISSTPSADDDVNMLIAAFQVLKLLPPLLYASVLLQAARKTERSRWDLLFFHSSEPRDLFKIFMNSNKLDFATAALPIMKEAGSGSELERLKATHGNSIFLMELCLEQRNMAIVEQIWRFNRSLELELGELKEEIPLSGAAIIRRFHGEKYSPQEIESLGKRWLDIVGYATE